MSAGEQVVLVNENQTDPLNIANPALSVFETMVTIFLTRLEELDQKVTKKLRQSILDQVSLRLSTLAERQRLHAWIMGTSDRLEINIEVGDMQNCVHHAYHSACEYFGPGETDKLLTQALKQTEGMPVAKDFSPRNLLKI